jgi:hypothetical protein
MKNLDITITFDLGHIEILFAEWVRMNYSDFEPYLVTASVDQDNDRNPGSPYLSSISVKCKRK